MRRSASAGGREWIERDAQSVHWCMVIKGLIERDAAGKLTLTKQGRAVLAALLMEEGD